MIIVKAKNIEVHSNVEHGFFGRQGGVSEGIYASLNCGVGSNDNPQHVKENRVLVAQYFSQEINALQSVWQIHSSDCVAVNTLLPVDGDRPKADAMVTDKPNMILGVLTADCGPILLSGQKSDGSPVIGAAHAGWRGAVDGILGGVVDGMQQQGAQIETIKAAVGPCIGPASYEVSVDFIKPFIRQSEENEVFFKDTNKDNHLMFDLPGYIASRLSQAGVKDVFITGHDTYAETVKFFSYRRKTHNDEADYGRQISAIMINA